MEIRDSIYNIIVENKEDFYIDFEGNDENKCLLSNGYYGYNIFNIYDKDNDNERIKKIYIYYLLMK